MLALVPTRAEKVWEYDFKPKTTIDEGVSLVRQIPERNKNNNFVYFDGWRFCSNVGFSTRQIFNP